MRRRILSAIVVIAGLAVAGFGIPLGIALSSTYRSSARLELQREASAAATSVPASFGSSSDPVELPDSDGDTVLALYDAAGNRVSGVGPVSADPVVRAALGGSATDGTTGGDLVAAVPVSQAERVVGIVRAARPESHVWSSIWRAWAVMGALGIGVLAVAAAVATWQARRLSRPLEHLALAARRLGDGDFTARTERSGIVEIDQAGTALDRTAERLGTTIERERQFSADVSHQLRTPLTALRLDLDNAVSTPGIDRDAAIRDAFDAIDRMEDTIDDLIALRRDLASQHALVDVRDLISELEDTWRGALAEQGRPLRVVVDDDPTSTRLDVPGPALRQILSVLVGNAAEHGAGTVAVEVASDPGWLRVEVSDEGPGLPADPDLLFSRRVDRHGGRGIGLPLARSLAEAEGGRLTYARTDRTRFSVLLPLLEGGAS